MSEQSPVDLKALLGKSGFLEKGTLVSETVFHLPWGSAEVVVGVTGHAVAVFAPMFKELPAGKEALFCLRLLQLNDTMGGVASFAMAPDGWVVLHAGRSSKDMSAEQLAELVTAVGELADLYDDRLYQEFFAPPEAARPNASDASDASQLEAENAATGTDAPAAAPDDATGPA